MNRIRRKLTLSYSGWFFITLIVVLMLVYWFMKISVYDEVKKEMHAYLQNEKNAVEKGHRGDFYKDFEDRLEHPFGFFDVYLTSSGVLSKQETDDSKKYSLAIQKQKPKCSNHVILTQLSLKNGKEVDTALISTSIMKRDKQIGTLYVGKDISLEQQSIQSWLILLVGIAAVLFLISVMIGHFLAKRAMVPILNNIERQRKFVADASHELNTPLSILQASIEVIKRDSGNSFSEYSSEVLGDMKDEMKHMDRLAGHLLTIASHQGGHLRVTDEIFPIDELAASVIKRFEILNQKTERRIQIEISPSESWLVSADRARIEQLLYVLLENAIKFTSDKGTIEVSLSRPTEHVVRLIVQDDGIGIPEKEQKRIFDPFYRAEKTRTQSYEGSGLGLSIVQATVNAYNGSIELQSEVGQGSRFIIDLPILID